MSQRESEAGSAFVPLAVASSAESSGIVMSAFSATRASRNARCGSSLAWRRPPLGLGASAPIARKDFISLTTKETDTLKCAASSHLGETHEQGPLSTNRSRQCVEELLRHQVSRCATERRFSDRGIGLHRR